MTALLKSRSTDTAAATFHSVFSSPLGELVLTSDGLSLTGLLMGPGEGRDPRAFTRPDEGPFRAVRRQLQAYFDGELSEFDVPLSLAGTPFQRRVWEELRRIPFGTTISFYAPRDEVESRLVRRAAILSWKLDRADRYENAVLSQKVLDSIDACDCEDDDVPALDRAAALSLFDPSHEGERLRRYQFSLERALQKAIETLSKPRREEAKSTEAGSDGAIKANPAAPNKANSALASGVASVEKGDRHAGYREPVPVSAPNKANSAVPNKPNSSEVAEGQGIDTPRSPIDAPRSPIQTAPNKANLVAPNKAISARVARELDRFVSGSSPTDPRRASWLDISIEKR